MKQKVDYHSHSSFNYALFITELLADVTQKEIRVFSTLHPNDLKAYTSSFVSFSINALPLNIEDKYFEEAIKEDEKATEIYTKYLRTKEYYPDSIKEIVKTISRLRKEIMSVTKGYWNRLVFSKSADDVLTDIATR